MIAPAKANASTLVMQGCGKISDRYLFCDVEEGVPSTIPISIHFPELKCVYESCGVVEVIQNGRTVYQASLKKGQSSIKFLLKDLIDQKEAIGFDEDTEFQIIGRFFVTINRTTYSATATGPLRLWVYARGYSHISCNDPNVFTSRKLTQTCSAQYTSKFRTALCGDCK